MMIYDGIDLHDPDQVEQRRKDVEQQIRTLREDKSQLLEQLSQLEHQARYLRNVQREQAGLGHAWN